jgi:hypothetical protein
MIGNPGIPMSSNAHIKSKIWQNYYFMKPQPSKAHQQIKSPYLQKILNTRCWQYYDHIVTTNSLDLESSEEIRQSLKLKQAFDEAVYALRAKGDSKPAQEVESYLLNLRRSIDELNRFTDDGVLAAPEYQQFLQSLDDEIDPRQLREFYHKEFQRHYRAKDLAMLLVYEAAAFDDHNEKTRLDHLRMIAENALWQYYDFQIKRSNLEFPTSIEIKTTCKIPQAFRKLSSSLKCSDYKDRSEDISTYLYRFRISIKASGYFPQKNLLTEQEYTQFIEYLDSLSS